MVRNGDWHSVAMAQIFNYNIKIYVQIFVVDFCIATLALRMQNLDVL